MTAQPPPPDPWGSGGSGPPPIAPSPVAPFSPLVGRPLVPNETTWSMLAHLSIFVLAVIGPIIIMVTEGNKSAYTRHHAVEALNMHLTLLIAVTVCMVLACLLLPLLVAVGLAIAACIFGVLAGMAASRGEIYRYPWTIRMVK